MGGLFGGGDDGAGERAQATKLRKEQNDRYEEALKYYEDLGVPSVEAQKIALQTAQLGPSAMEDIQTDPRLKNAQMDALSSMQKMGDSGLTDQEKAQQFMISRGVSGEAKARDKSILQNMAERGIGGSGAELMARLQGSQSAADRGAVEQAQLAGQVQNRSLNALAQAGQLGGQIRGQDFGQASQKASAADRINQFNASNAAGTANQQEMYNKGLIQQKYQNDLGLVSSKANTKIGQGSVAGQQAAQQLAAGQAKAEGAAQSKAGALGAVGTLAGAGIGAYFGGPGGRAAGAKLGAGIGGAASGLFADGGVLGTPGYREGYADGGVPSSNMNSNGGFAGGGIPVPDESGMEDESRYLEGDVVPGDSFEGDRVDAKINSGEMVLNIEQQQRLMELLKGLRDLKGLGGEDIIEGGEQPSPDVMGNPAPEQEIGQDLQFRDGGAVFESANDTDSSERANKPRGIHNGLNHEREAEEKSNVASKERKARIKAYETLINGGK